MTREQPKQGSVGILMRPNPKEGLTVRHIGVGGKPLITHNYMPNVVEGFNAICDDLRRSQPHGRLFVLEGPPGTGKTFLIRALMDAVIARFILIQPKLMAELSDPEVLLTFVNDEIQTIEDACDPTPDPPVVLVCEDADTMLAKRSDQHGSLVSVLNALAIGDGIIGELLDIRLIATTNVEVGDLDPAILRPGRLSHRLIVGALNHDQARKVWRELVGDLPLPKRKDDYTLAELYALARGACTPPGQGSLSIDHSTPQDAPERLSSIEDDPSVV
jgi:SpoVK/Ycf46/Vps4 family AAA+-type ATPase